MNFLKYFCILNYFSIFYVFNKLIEVETQGDFSIDENEIPIDEEEAGSKAGLTVEEHEIIFRYYNQEYINGDRIHIQNVSQQTLRYWKKNKDLKIITHGWLSSEKSMAVEGVKNAYLAKKDINIITVDWSLSASWKMYPLPAYFTGQVGAIIARLIDELIYKDYITKEYVHIIGHSLGSHVAGATGAAVKTGPVARITGLDPAGPGFEHVQHIMNNALDVSDGKFVDVIHTAAGAAGYSQPLGHADFYPNGGTSPQPGCLETSSMAEKIRSFSCSHGRAYDYFTDSIMYPHTYRAYKCDTLEALKNLSCAAYPTVYMGDETTSSARGIYYLRTNQKAPYGYGS